MTKEQAFVGLRVKYEIRHTYGSRKKDHRLKAHYGVVVLLKEKECVVKFAAAVERPCLYSKLEPIV